MFDPSINDDKEDKKDITKAVQHHIDNNPHHWENWTKNDDGLQDLHLVHNICDWMAMGAKFGDTAREYYNRNKGKIHLPDWAVKMMYEIFDCVYGEEKIPI